MNHLFFPNRAKSVAGKTGINRVRKIIKYEKKPEKNADQSNNNNNNNNLILHNNIPTSWFYNKNAADKVWDGLEQTEKERQQILKRDNNNTEDTNNNNEEEINKNNPFYKIDKSTTKIRQLIDSYGISDQEFLINLMEMLEYDAGIDSLDQQSILLEARLRLATMIDEHVGNSDAQSRMLDSLRVFFNDFQQDNQATIENEMTNLSDFDNGVDSTQLATLINDACEKNEVCSEQASHIHKAIVDSFTRQMRDLKQEINSRDEKIKDLQQQIDQYQRNRRNRRAEISIRKMKETTQQLAGAHRKICEQQHTIDNLKSALKGKDDGEDKDEGKFSPSHSSGSLLNEKISSQSILNEDDADEGEFSSDREFELMSRIHYLTEQVQSLKAEVSDNMKQIKELKFTSIDLNNNYLNMERMKKATDQTIISLNEKYEFMENMYKKKLAEAHNGEKVLNEKSDNQVIADLRIEYENKIHSIKEQARQTQQQALDIAEKRHRMQMNDMLKSLESSDQSAALSEVMKNQESSISEVTERHKKQIIELKNMNNEKIRSLTKQYETKLIDAFKQNETLRLSLKDDIDASLLKQKIELEASFQKKLNNCEADADDKYEKMKKKMIEKINSVENLNKKLMNERDALRDALEDAQIVVDIPNAENEFDIENEEEDEYEIDNKNDNQSEEIKLFDKNWADQQVRKIKDEYNSLMNQQRENILKTKEWELEQMKKELIRGFEEQMAQNRRNIVSDLTELREKVSNSTSTTEIGEQLDNIIINLLKGVEKQGQIGDNIANREPMISLNEANEKMEELNKKIVEVSTENDLLRNTVGKLSNNRSLKDPDGNDIIKIMHQSIAEEAKKINELLLENGNLKEELEKAKSEINELKQSNEKNLQEQREKYEKEIELLKEKISQKEEEVSTSFSGSISMPIKPSYMIENVSSDDYNIKENNKKDFICSKCGEKISVNPIVLQVSTIEAPVVECPFCHEAVQLNQTDIESPFPKEEFNKQQLEKIGKMENDIKTEIMNLIQIKKQMREGIDMDASCQQVVKINESKNEVILTPNFDMTIFTLPPNQNVLTNKLQKSSTKIANARSFSPSTNRHLTRDQRERITQMEDDIDKKINNLIDFKVKSNSSNKGSSSNIIIVDDDSSLKISKEIFFDSSVEKTPKENNMSPYFVIFEMTPISLKNKSGRLISASHSCNINRVSFNSAFLKPPIKQHNNNNNINNINNETEKNQTNSNFSSGYDGTSLDGSQNPFTRSLSDIINTQSEETISRDQLQLQQTKGSQQNLLQQPNKKIDPVMKPALPLLDPLKNGQIRPRLPPSNALSIQQVQLFRRPTLSKSVVTSIDILPWERTTIEDAHIERGGNVLARLQSQFLRSQQQQQQNVQQSEATKNDNNNNDSNSNGVFLTPEADLVSLQLSDVGYFSLRNSRPSSSVQPRSELPTEASPTSSASLDINVNNEVGSDVSFADRLFERNVPTGDPRSIDEFRHDLDSWRKQMAELKDQYKSMMNSYNDINNMTHELIQRHNEVVKVLTKALDTAMSLARGDAEHPEALIEKMQEQSAYLTTVIREKEVLHGQSNEQLLALNERMQEVMQMHGETAEMEDEISRLQRQLKEVTAREKDNINKIHALEQFETASKENDSFQKDQINSMADKLEIEFKKNFESQKVVDNLNVKIEQLQTQLVIASKASEVDMTFVDPFIIFSINENEGNIQEKSNNKYKGFGLQPKSSRNLSSTKSLPQNDETEKTEETEKEPHKESELIRISSLKTKEVKSSNSKESFAVFQPEFSKESENKMIYTTSKTDETSEQDQKEIQNNRPDSPSKSGDPNESEPSLNCQLAINQASIISGRIVENQKAQNLKIRLQQLESTLLQKTNENSEVREELHTTQQHLFKLTNANAKLEREIKKVEIKCEVTVKKLQDSMELVTTLSTENESLKKLVEQYKQMSLKFAEELKKASSYEQSKNVALLGEMKTRNLLHDIQKAEPTNYALKSFAERQALTLARLEGKRRYLQEKERERIMSALQALNFIKIDPNYDIKSSGSKYNKANITKNKSLTSGMKVITYNLSKKSLGLDDDQPHETSHQNNNVHFEADHSKSMPSFEEALKTANSHNQKVSKLLQLGIVANPLKV